MIFFVTQNTCNTTENHMLFKSKVVTENKTDVTWNTFLHCHMSIIIFCRSTHIHRLEHFKAVHMILMLLDVARLCFRWQTCPSGHWVVIKAFCHFLKVQVNPWRHTVKKQETFCRSAKMIATFLTIWKKFWRFVNSEAPCAKGAAYKPFVQQVPITSTFQGETHCITDTTGRKYSLSKWRKDVVYCSS